MDEQKRKTVKEYALTFIACAYILFGWIPVVGVTNWLLGLNPLAAVGGAIVTIFAWPAIPWTLFDIINRQTPQEDN